MGASISFVRSGSSRCKPGSIRSRRSGRSSSARSRSTRSARATTSWGSARGRAGVGAAVDHRGRRSRDRVRRVHRRDRRLVPTRPAQLCRSCARGRDPVRPDVGGHLVEVYDADTGAGHDDGSTSSCGSRDDGSSSSTTARPKSTCGSSPTATARTRVTLEHRGLERLAPDEAVLHTKFGGQLLMKWYGAYMRTRRMTRKEIDVSEEIPTTTRPCARTSTTRTLQR